MQSKIANVVTPLIVGLIAVSLTTQIRAQSSTYCPDADSDGMIGVTDILSLLSLYGSEYSCAEETNDETDFFAIVFCDSGEDNQFAEDPNTDLLRYMYEQLGDNAWYGFNAGSGVNGANANDLAVYMDWPGWFTGTENNLIGAITTAVPLVDGGLDAYGNYKSAGSFETVEIPANSVKGNVWYSFWVPLDLLNAGGQIPTNSLVSFNSSANCFTSLGVDSNLSNIDVEYTGPNWPNTTYRVFSGNGGYNQGSSGTWDTTTNYFKGGG